MKHAWKALVLSAVLLCAACSDSASTSATSAGAPKADAAATAGGVKAAPAVASINAMCPIMGNEVTAEGGTFEYAGKTVGFCCAKCSGKFAALDDAGKLNALAKNGTTLPR